MVARAQLHRAALEAIIPQSWDKRVPVPVQKALVWNVLDIIAEFSLGWPLDIRIGIYDDEDYSKHSREKIANERSAARRTDRNQAHIAK